MSTATVTLKIDGVETTVPQGTTILKAARDAGVAIPTPLAHPGPRGDILALGKLKIQVLLRNI